MHESRHLIVQVGHVGAISNCRAWLNNLDHAYTMHEPRYLHAGLELIQAELKLHILLIHSPLQSLPLPTHPCQDLGLLAPADQQAASMIRHPVLALTCQHHQQREKIEFGIMSHVMQAMGGEDGG